MEVFYQILILIIILVLSAIAFKISFNFDLNKYLEDRRKIKLDQLKNICPHCKIELMENGQIGVQSYFFSPPGTYQWICSRCHCVVESEDRVNQVNEYHAKHPDVFLKKEKRFQRKIKKLGLA